MSTGYVQSIEVGSFVDGPGLRFVVFLSNCPLRCQYCHNPESWTCRGEQTESKDLLAQISRAAGFLKEGHGGVTVSGGEPLSQAEFAYDILLGSKRLRLHTALDTSGYLGDRMSDEMLDQVDLVLLDVKSWDPEVYRKLTGVELEPTLRFAERLAGMCKPVWIRFVLVPGLTDEADNMAGLAAFASSLSNVERMEVVPFHQMGRHKWEELGLVYPLASAAEPTEEQMGHASSVFAAAGLPVARSRRLPCASTGEG